jgi:hypothetical protein
VRRNVLLWTMALVVLCAITAAAADINGKWLSSAPGRDGTPQETTYVFKVAGDAVTGTITTARGEQAISEGKLIGDDLSFATVRDMGGNTVKFLYKGKVAGNEITLTRTREGGAGGPGGAPGGGAPGGGGRGGPQTLTLKKVV